MSDNHTGDPNHVCMTPYCDIAVWHAEAARAARGHLFASRLPAAALLWGQCTLTATEAVTNLGEDIADIRKYESVDWKWITTVLEVPVPIAMAWAVEGRTRQGLAVLGDFLQRYWASLTLSPRPARGQAETRRSSNTSTN